MVTSSATTLLVRHARLRHRPGTWTVRIAGGQIAEVVPDDRDLADPGGTAGSARTVGSAGSVRTAGGRDADDRTDIGHSDVVEADGNLVTPPFHDGHLHLCKVGTLDLAGPEALGEYTSGSMGGSLSAIERAATVKRGQTVERVLAGARRALDDGIRHGVRSVQAFADVDPVAGLTGVRGLLAARAEYRDRIEVRVVAFPQDGLLCAPGTAELMREAVALGVDVVGGIPWIEHTDTDAREHVRQLVELARANDLRVAMLVDDAGDANLRTTEMLAQALVERGMIGRGSAQHARALGLYPEPTLRRAIGLFRVAGLGFVTDPHTGPLHLPVTTLLDAGIPVALGQDDIEDAYYPFGRHNMLEVAFLAAHILGYLDDARLDRLLDMLTVQAATVMGVPAHDIAPGAPADLLVLDGRTPREVIGRHAAPRQVIVGGRVVAGTAATAATADAEPARAIE